MNTNLVLKTGRATIATILLSLCLAMFLFEKEYFPFTPSVLYLLGLFIGVRLIDEPKKNTLKDLLPAMLLGLFIVGLLIFTYNRLPFLHNQPYKSIIWAMFISLHIIIIWWQWYKRIKRLDNGRNTNNFTV